MQTSARPSEGNALYRAIDCSLGYDALENSTNSVCELQVRIAANRSDLLALSERISAPVYDTKRWYNLSLHQYIAQKN